MGERICLCATLIGIAKLFLKVVAAIYTLPGDVLKGFCFKLLGQTKLQVMGKAS